MHDVVTINEAIRRAKSEGYPISECCLRRWVRTGEIPHRMAGRKILIFYPRLVQYLKCEDGGADTPATDIPVSGIRRLEV